MCNIFPHLNSGVCGVQSVWSVRVRVCVMRAACVAWTTWTVDTRLEFSPVKRENVRCERWSEWARTAALGGGRVGGV